MNISETMKIKRQIQATCNIETKMLDLPEIGLVLTVERSSIDIKAYKLLADFAATKNLSLKLEIGSFIISDLPLVDSPRPPEK
jgi:hypothetical protein